MDRSRTGTKPILRNINVTKVYATLTYFTEGCAVTIPAYEDEVIGRFVSQEFAHKCVVTDPSIGNLMAEIALNVPDSYGFTIHTKVIHECVECKMSITDFYKHAKILDVYTY